MPEGGGGQRKSFSKRLFVPENTAYLLESEYRVSKRTIKKPLRFATLFIVIHFSLKLKRTGAQNRWQVAQLWEEGNNVPQQYILIDRTQYTKQSSLAKPYSTPYNTLNTS